MMKGQKMPEDPSTNQTTDSERLQFLLGVYFRTQAAIEKYMGRDGLPMWTERIAEINANATKNRLPEAIDQARSLLSSLATMLDVYGSDMTMSEDNGQFRLDVRKCGIYDYRERAQQQGVELTLPTPCEFCVDLRYRTAAHLGVPVSHKLGERSCQWVAHTPDSTQEGSADD
jgi:hypothetical protein